MIDGAAAPRVMRPTEAISGAALAERTTTTTAAARGDCDDLKTDTPDECALRATEESISFRE
jgi:hypothetical protein